MAPTAELLRTLKGVAQAADASETLVEAASCWVSSLELAELDNEGDLLGRSLQAVAVERGNEDDETTHLVKLTLIIIYMRRKCQNVAPRDSLKAEELKIIWDVIRAALLSRLFAQKRAVRSHQGFLSVPLCDLRKANGDNEELWRVHLWLPNRPQPDPEFIIHSHKSYAQSWILAGEGTNGEYEVNSAQEKEAATHAIYALVDQRTITHQQPSTTIENTGKFVNVKGREFETHTRDMSYVVPAATFHTSQVPLEKAHATIFFFDASRGYFDDGGVSLGPKDLSRVEQNRDPGGVTAAALVSIVDAVRNWEVAVDEGLSFARKGEWYEAKLSFGRITKTWNTHRMNLDDGLERGSLPTTGNDLQSLNRYMDIAQRLVSWTEHIARGQSHDYKGDTTTAMREFNIALEICCSIPDMTIMRKCQGVAQAGS
ncbi:hypothetical protein FQN54_004407 [Arachnomyces sp. PD_36]|nr:hypothetical protein FQN54_004407 [Arachnomyces sp. PD_36]